MIKKNYYKKIFIGVAALFILLVPAGVTVKSQATAAAGPATQNSFSGSAYSSFSLKFNLNLAEATGSQPASAGTPASPSFLDCLTGGETATCGVYFVAYAVNSIISLGVALGAALIRFGLQLNDNVYNSPAVLTGFSVILSLANLGFVLGIIIIAIATIIRNQTYGMKQLLWKLVVMAILVNFGLVITAPIVGFADSLSNYFVNATAPQSVTSGYEAYVNTITGAFAPQAVNTNPSTTSGGATTPSTICSGGGTGTNLIRAATGVAAICALVNTATGKTSPDLFIQQFNAMIFGIIFSSLTVFTFLCLGILLFVRYLMLSGLLIVLPLAWLTFIFPKFDSSFSKWWNAFVKWTLFPPIALFFIYLAMITISNIPGTVNNPGNYLSTATALPASATTGPEGALVYQTGLGGPIQSALDEFLLVGLTIMGLMFANSLSGKAGSTVVNGATHVGKMAAGYIGKKGKRWAGDRVRTAGRKYNPETKETTSLVQRFGARLQGVPGLKKAGSTLSNYAAPKAVQEERKEDVKKYIADNLTNLTNDGLKARATSATAFVNPTVAAAIAQELARRDLTNDKKIAPLMGKYVEYAEKMGTAEAVYNNRPDLVEPRMLAATATSPARMETKEEAVGRAIGAAKGDVVNVTSEMFNFTNPGTAATKLGIVDAAGNPDPVKAKGLIGAAILKLTPAQLGALGSDQSSGSQARQNNITDAMREMIRTFNLSTVNPTTGKKELDDAALQRQITRATAAGAPKSVIDGLKNIEKIVKHMENSPNWGSVLT